MDSVGLGCMAAGEQHIKTRFAKGWAGEDSNLRPKDYERLPAAHAPSREPRRTPLTKRANTANRVATNTRQNLPASGRKYAEGMAA